MLALAQFPLAVRITPSPRMASGDASPSVAKPATSSLVAFEVAGLPSAASRSWERSCVALPTLREVEVAP